MLRFGAMVAGLALFGSSAAAPVAYAGGDWLPQGARVGGSVIVAPKYEGAKDYRVSGAPIFAPLGSALESGTVQFRGIDDIRFRVLSLYGLEAGPLAGWRFSREEDDADRLRGLGDVDGGFVGGGYVAFRNDVLTPFVSYHHQLSGDDTGGVLRFGVETQLPFSPGLSFRATAGASYMDDDYADAFFTVTPGQNASSSANLAIYEADAGIKDIYFGISGDIPLSAAWTLSMRARYARLIGDAADSPIVEDENQFSGGLGLSYKLMWGRR